MSVNGVNTTKVDQFLNTGDSSIFNVGGSVQFMNSAWTKYYQAYQNAGTEVQRNQVRQSFLETAFNTAMNWGSKFVSAIFGGKEAEAEEDVNNTNKKIEDGKEEVQTQIKVTEAEITKALADVDIRVNTINDLLDQVKEIQDQEIANLVHELELAKAEIEAQKEILNNPESTNEEKKKAIDTINSQGEVIADLCTEIDNKYKEITTCQDKVEDEEDDIDDINNDIEHTLAAGEQNVQKTIVQTSSEVTADNTLHTATGSSETIEGETLLAAAEGEEIGGLVTCGVSTVAAQGTKQEALDLIAAGSTHTGGAATNTTALATSTAQSNGNLVQSVTRTTATVGSYNNMANNILGDVYSQIESTITSIGSWDNINSSNEDLFAAVDEYESQMDEEGEQEQNNEDDDALEFKFDTSRFNLEVA